MKPANRKCKKKVHNSPVNVQIKAMDRGCDKYGIACLYLPDACHENGAYFANMRVT